MLDRRWEVLQLVGNNWVNAWAEHDDEGERPLQFNTREEAQAELDAHFADYEAAVRDGHMECVPSRDEFTIAQTIRASPYAEGYRFKLAGWRYGEAGSLDMLITYKFHNGAMWRYHAGRVIGKEGDPVPAPWDNNCPVHYREGLMYVDYFTMDEQEVAAYGF